MSGSLRSARHRAERCAVNERATLRKERLYVRLTADEAARVAALAAARGLTVSDFARRALLRGGPSRLMGRHKLSTDAAGKIRQLSAVAVELRRILAFAEAHGSVCEAELRECLVRLRAAIGEAAA